MQQPWTFSPTKLAVIGLGYVGLPLAAEFGKRFPVVGFDIQTSRIEELQAGYDRTLEVERSDLEESRQLIYTSDAETLRECNVFIVTVPTPINHAKRPDLSALVRASHTVGRVMRRGSVVIYESTVYPGVTEDVCVPILERESGLVFNKEFFAGYSPERINRGDKVHRLPDIAKVTSGSTAEAADFVDRLYGTIARAGTHRAPSIKVAEAGAERLPRLGKANHVLYEVKALLPKGAADVRL